MIQAKVIADSKNEFGDRITSMIVVMPRYILAEFNTHRMLSKNSASSRAIPFEKMLKMVKENPFIPIAWMKDHKGMQGTEFFTDKDKVYIENYPLNGKSIPYVLERNWGIAMDESLIVAQALNQIGLTKQLCNRLLEPFMWHQVLVTATEWENFFALRCPQYEIGISEPGKENKFVKFRSKKDAINNFPYFKDLTHIQWLLNNTGQAEIHMMALAEAIWDAKNKSIPSKLKAGEWHIPFGDQIDEMELRRTLQPNNKELRGIGVLAPDIEESLRIDEAKIKIATARAARLSYKTLGDEKEHTYEADIKVHDSLVKNGHWSPFEHCARTMGEEEYLRSLKISLCDKDTISNKRGDYVFKVGDHYILEERGWSGNFKGFIQYRKMFLNENRI